MLHDSSTRPNIIFVDFRTRTKISDATAPLSPATLAANLPTVQNDPVPLINPAPLAIQTPLKRKPKCKRLPTDWPYPGGRQFRPCSTLSFTSPAWLDVWRPGLTREVYMGQCPGLGDLSRKLQMPLSKLSTCGPGRIWDRNGELSIDRYGAAYRKDEDIITQPGFDDWSPTLFYPRLLPSPGSPVIVQPRGLIVTLPESMEPLAFDAAFDAQTALASLDTWAGSTAARRHFATLGLPIEIAQRLTLYSAGETPRISRACEICAFSIYSGADRLIAIIELILLRHAGLVP